MFQRTMPTTWVKTAGDGDRVSAEEEQSIVDTQAGNKRLPTALALIAVALVLAATAALVVLRRDVVRRT